MTMRSRRAVAAIATALALTIAGCGGGDDDDTASSDPSTSGTSIDDAAGDGDDTSATTDGSATTEPPAANDDGDGLVAMPLSTSGEEAAFALADSDEGRRWASGNPDGSLGTAVGDPVLGGYVVKLNDGTTEHQVKVLNGVAVLFFSSFGPPTIEAPFDPHWPTLPPESEQQETAMAAAIAYVADIAPGMTAGGIDGYVFYFPQTEEGGSRPAVTIAADRGEGITFQSGGTQVL